MQVSSRLRYGFTWVNTHGVGTPEMPWAAMKGSGNGCDMSVYSLDAYSAIDVMLSALDDVNSVGPKMAVALITTFYGALLANLIFIPMTVKLKRRSAAEALEMNLVLEGITFIRKGVNPRFMKETLENLLDNAIGKKTKNDEEGQGGGKK